MNGLVNRLRDEEVLVESRMHLSQEQAKSLAKKLLYFAKHGVLEEGT